MGLSLGLSVLVSLIGARTHQNCPELAKKCRFYLLKQSSVHRQTSKVYLMSTDLGR